MEQAKPIDFRNTDGHIILYCKLHYKGEDIDWMEGMFRLMAAQCGWSGVEHHFSREAAADRLYKIIAQTKDKDGLERYMLSIHRRLSSPFDYENDPKRSSIENLIRCYMAEVQNLRVNRMDKETGKWKSLMYLPKPQKRIARRFIKGEFDYSTIDKIS